MKNFRQKKHPGWYQIPVMAIAFFILICSCRAQITHHGQQFTHQDTLRGTITPERAWWDVVQYRISVQPDYDNKTIAGSNAIVFRVVAPGRKMQIDLQEPMQLKSAVCEGSKIPFAREGNVYHLDFPRELKEHQVYTLDLDFEGKPKEAVNPPWDGGWIWKKDKLGRPWVSVACQGLGASVWYPCKDHQSDEPDSASLSITVADTLVAVGNGRLRQQKAAGKGMTTFTWAVTNPINNYNIIPYIGKYVNWTETFAGEKGPLDCSYWVLDYNLAKAKEQFKQAKDMLKCFEHWFGPYPFYEDSYKLVESPHLGMEHQSAVAYGNGYENGYRGRDLSGTGWGKKWDFIIVHESGHEWFANSITSNDLADMWIHEGFANYSETLFTTCQFGVKAGNEYVIGTRRLIQNDKPIIGRYGVNQEGSGDMYYKGGNLLHTIRQIVNDDEKFRMILRGLNKNFYHKTVNSTDIEKYISEKAGRDLSKVFDQYLRTTDIPVLEYRMHKGSADYRWTNSVAGFDMPVKIKAGDAKEQWVQPSAEWKTISFTGSRHPKTLTADPNFYIQTKEIK